MEEGRKEVAKQVRVADSCRVNSSAEGGKM